MADHKSSGTDTVVKVVLVFFISLLSFSIGTFVGKKFSDKQHKMASLEPGHSSKSNDHSEDEDESRSNHANKADDSSTGSNDHNEHETSLTEEEANVMGEEMNSEDEAEHSASGHKKGESVASNTKLTKVLAREIASQGTAKYTIQVASFPTQEEAEKRVNELKSQKLESFSTETTIKGHQWYRVNVGVFPTIKEAQEKKAQLADQSKITSTIIQKLKK